MQKIFVIVKTLFWKIFDIFISSIRRNRWCLKIFYNKKILRQLTVDHPEVFLGIIRHVTQKNCWLLYRVEMWRQGDKSSVHYQGIKNWGSSKCKVDGKKSRRLLLSHISNGVVQALCERIVYLQRETFTFCSGMKTTLQALDACVCLPLGQNGVLANVCEMASLRPTCCQGFWRNTQHDITGLHVGARSEKKNIPRLSENDILSPPLLHYADIYS